jgi:ParB/RepB/Spo0J family partition protein
VKVAEAVKTEAVKTVKIPLELLDPPIAILRTAEEYEDVDKLAESIKQTGQLQPILVAERNGRYIVVDGWSRVNAARKIGLKEVEAVIRELPDEKKIRLATLASQVTHRDINPVKLAEEVKLLLDQGTTIEEISKSTGLSKNKILTLNETAKLPAELKEKFIKHKLKYTHILNIFKYHSNLLATPDMLTDELLEKIAKNPTTHVVNILKEAGNSILTTKIDVDKLIDKTLDLAAKTLKAARMRGIEKKTACEMAIEILNVYSIKPTCPWCGKKGEPEEFLTEGT